MAQMRIKPIRLLPAVGITIIVLLSGACSSADSGESVAPAAVGQEEMIKLPEADTFGTVSGAPTDPRVDVGAVAGKVFHPKREMIVYAGVGGTPIARLPALQMGSPTWTPVVAEQGDWVEVLLPTRPNSAAGWVHAEAGSFETARNEFAIKVDRARFTLEITENGKSIGKWTIGTGKPEHPTPAGRAYIIASIAETKNTYSPIVLPLSYHSDSLETFGGGPGTVGLHTWPNDSFVGKASSDGCIRVPRDALDQLVKVPLGTIVDIT
ncbi:L,D-transpeptidase [Amycolatopsis taiwanensis]|uniref:L,D-transpeptidase n=1 Tax=Amycolatopsis taiwanensis TaxID=342230 RepID=UPI0009FE72E5|nr:L,D-transpeptidase [Amycolatopsis taiwanensis]